MISIKRIAILQPSYLPWLGYFDLMARSNTFVYLDDVQYTRRDWRNRNKIRTTDGWAWLTVPVIQKGKFNQSLLDAQIDCSTAWHQSHLQSIKHHYAKTPYFDLYFPALQTILNKDHKYLVDLCLCLTNWIKDTLGIPAPTLRSSEMSIQGKKADRILEICRKLEATHYVTGDLGLDYLSEEEFLRYNIKLESHEYRHPEYRQKYAEFIPYLSVLDLMFNQGEKSLEILAQSSAKTE